MQTLSCHLGLSTGSNKVQEYRAQASIRLVQGSGLSALRVHRDWLWGVGGVGGQLRLGAQLARLQRAVQCTHLLAVPSDLTPKP